MATPLSGGVGYRYDTGDRVRCLLTYNATTAEFLGTVLPTKSTAGPDWDAYLVRFDQPLPDGKSERVVEEPDMNPLGLLEQIADAAQRGS